MNKLIRGLQILSDHYDKPNLYNLIANDNIIFAYNTDKAIPKELVDEMVNLGWYQIVSGDNFTSEDYDLEKAWLFHI